MNPIVKAFEENKHNCKIVDEAICWIDDHYGDNLIVWLMFERNKKERGNNVIRCVKS